MRLQALAVLYSRYSSKLLEADPVELQKCSPFSLSVSCMDCVHINELRFSQLCPNVMSSPVQGTKDVSVCIAWAAPHQLCRLKLEVCFQKSQGKREARLGLVVCAWSSDALTSQLRSFFILLPCEWICTWRLSLVAESEAALAQSLSKDTICITALTEKKLMHNVHAKPEYTINKGHSFAELPSWVRNGVPCKSGKICSSGMEVVHHLWHLLLQQKPSRSLLPGTSDQETDDQWSAACTCAVGSPAGC